jgi:phosphatidylglycerophosphatase A
LGIAIACYIAGAKGIFEFVRFDQAKPGILKKLGPISNDAIGGLIAGVSSNMYTRALRGLKNPK